MRTKSVDNTRILSKSALDSLLSKGKGITIPSGVEIALNDNTNYGDDDEDDENYDDNSESPDDKDYDDDEEITGNEDIINAFKRGDDPNKILNTWKNKQDNERRQEELASSSQKIRRKNPLSSSSSLDLDEDGQLTAAGNHLPGPPRDLVAQIVKPRFVAISWMEPVKNPDEVISYTVYYKMNNSER